MMTYNNKGKRECLPGELGHLPPANKTPKEIVNEMPKMAGIDQKATELGMMCWSWACMRLGKDKRKLRWWGTWWAAYACLRHAVKVSMRVLRACRITIQRMEKEKKNG